MDDLQLSQYRKIVALVVTGGIIFTLNHLGMDLHDLSPWGLSLGSIAEPIVEFIVLFGSAAVMAIAQPNEEGRSIFTYWRWIAIGAAVLAVMIALVLLVA